jgi:hypothetical protein
MDLEERSGRPQPWIYPLAIAALLLPPFAGFALGGISLGLLFGVLALGALILLAARSTPREPIAPGPLTPDAPTLALALTPVTDRTTAERVASVAREASADGGQILALMPVAPTATERWLSLRGTVRPDADERLERTLETLRATDCPVAGEIVDENPERAIADQAAVHGAAAIAFIVPPGWEDGKRVEAVRRRTDRPVHVIEAGA